MVTKEEAMTCRLFHHVSKKNRDGTPMRVRASGKCRTWKTRPTDFCLPIKYGLYESGYLTNVNAHEWVVAR